MPWYIGDYLRDTGNLSTEQHGAYLLLIAHCWQHGALPPTAEERANIARMTLARWKSTCAPVNRFFKDDGTHQRVTKERQRAEENVAKKSFAAAVRWSRRKANA